MYGTAPGLGFRFESSFSRGFGLLWTCWAWFALRDDILRVSKKLVLFFRLWVSLGVCKGTTSFGSTYIEPQLWMNVGKKAACLACGLGFKV